MKNKIYLRVLSSPPFLRQRTFSHVQPRWDNFSPRKTVGPSVFSGLSEEPFEASNVEVQGQEPTPESTGEVGMFRICC